MEWEVERGTGHAVERRKMQASVSMIGYCCCLEYDSSEGLCEDREELLR